MVLRFSRVRAVIFPLANDSSDGPRAHVKLFRYARRVLSVIVKPENFKLSFCFKFFSNLSYKPAIKNVLFSSLFKCLFYVLEAFEVFKVGFSDSFFCLFM